jgi:type I thyroxine 5'-deiodinase
MTNEVDLKYAALPDRLYLIGADGLVAYRSAPGPWGFKPDELEAAIKDYLAAAVAG